MFSNFRKGYQNRRGYFPNSEYVKIFGVIAGLLFLEWVFESENEKVGQDKDIWLSETIKRISETA